MNRQGTMVGAGALILVAVVTGVVVFSGEDSGDTERSGAKEERVAGSRGPVVRPLESPAAPSAAELRGLADLAELRKKLEELAVENARLKEAIQAAEAEKKKLQASLDQHVAFRGTTVAQVMESIDKLKAQDMNVFLMPGALSQLVADLKSLGDEGVDLMVGLLSSEDKTTRIMAAKVLEDLSDPRAVGAMRDAAIKDSEVMVRRLSSHGLALMEHPAALDPLHEIMKRADDEGVKVNAMYGLMKHGDAKGFELADAFLRNESNDKHLRGALAPGILLLTDPRTLPIADFCVKTYGDNEALLGMAVNYYKNLRIPASRIRLQEMSLNASYPDAVRRAAAVALGN